MLKSISFIRLSVVSVLSLLVWLLSDWIIVNMQWQWGGKINDFIYLLIQFLVFVFVFKDAFQSKPIVLAWSFRVFAAFLLLIIFLLLLLPIVLIFHQSIGGQF